MMRAVILWLMASLLALPSLGAAQAQSQALSIAASANLREVLPALIATYTQQHPVDITVNYAASGLLVQQLLHGAPYHLFLSANEAYAERVADALPSSLPACRYARGTLAFWSMTPSSPKGWQHDLMAGRWARIAIANPRHAPYGQAAQAALAELKPPAGTHLVQANNVSQVAQWAGQRVIDAGFLPTGLAQQLLSGQWVAVPQALYPPLWQSAVILPNSAAQPEASRFLSWLVGDEAAPVWLTWGYHPARGAGACG